MQRSLSLLMLAALAVPLSASAQLDLGRCFRPIVQGAVQVGVLHVDQPFEAWDWHGESWPQASFRVGRSADLTVGPDAEVTDDAPFPREASSALPEALGDDDRLYGLSVCDASGCERAGFLWVEDLGATLHWYLRPDWKGDYLTASPDDVVRFRYLSEVPSVSGPLRYVALDRH